MKSLLKIIVVLVVVVSVSSCQDKLNPNYQYMPNMYEAVGYETNAESAAFKSLSGENGKVGQLPPVGTIKRGFVPYEIPNSTAGYEFAKANLKSPLNATTVDMKKGQELFEIYCAICHGNAGDGKGKLVKQEKFLGVPSYKDRVITEGSIFHVVTYGLNSMGSHANQLSQEERWQVASYVVDLKSKL
jgi:mono/diheme cytochrome c family protein